MAKGYTDKSGTFHPIDDGKSSMSSDQVEDDSNNDCVDKAKADKIKDQKS